MINEKEIIAKRFLDCHKDDVKDNFYNISYNTIYNELLSEYFGKVFKDDDFLYIIIFGEVSKTGEYEMFKFHDVDDEHKNSHCENYFTRIDIISGDTV